MTWYQTRGSKYNAKSTEYNGEVYHSKKEAAYAQELDWRIKANDIKGYVRQKRISFDFCPSCRRLCSLKCKYHPREKVRHFTNYYIDFVVQENDGTETYTEIKGFETSEWQKKWFLLTLLYEDDETKKLVVIK